MKKQANIGRLPDQMNANISMVNGLRQQHESLSLQLRTEQDRLSMVEGQIEPDEAGRRRRHDVERRRRRSRGRRRAINELERQLRQYRRRATPISIPTSSPTKEELAVARRELTTARQQSPAATAPSCWRPTRPTGRRSRARRGPPAHRHPAAADEPGAGADRLVPVARRIGAARRTGAVVAAAGVRLERKRYEDLSLAAPEGAGRRRRHPQAGRRALRRAQPRVPADAADQPRPAAADG